MRQAEAEDHRADAAAGLDQLFDLGCNLFYVDAWAIKLPLS
jgi:hypothetical protein